MHAAAAAAAAAAVVVVVDQILVMEKVVRGVEGGHLGV